MTGGKPILLERENVNDESVILVQWFVQNGQWIEEGALIAEVETSKANVEVRAPYAGYLMREVEEKSSLSYEAPLGHIFDEPFDVDKAPRENRMAQMSENPSVISAGLNSSMPPAEPSESFVANLGDDLTFAASTGYGQRFSRRAQELIQENGLSKESFAGLSMVRALNVLRFMGGEPPQTSSNGSGPAAASSARAQIVIEKKAPPRLPTRQIPLTRMKRSEVQALVAGTRNAIPSSVTVTCLTHGLRAALVSNPVVLGNASAVIVYEVARLLRKYPAFNATYRNDNIMQYEQVNIGYAIDDGRGLKVAVLKGCDVKSLADIAEELRILVLAYLDNKLTPEQVSGATFTVSDLSGLGVASFVPLISEDQGAILGAGGEQFLPGSREGCYTLTLAFDHQLSEGRTAALFLNDLRDRLMHYEQAMSDLRKEQPACARCGRTAADLPDAKSFLVRSVVPPGYLCNLCMAGL